MGEGRREREIRNLLNHLYFWRSGGIKPLGVWVSCFHFFLEIALTEALVNINYYKMSMQILTLATGK